MKFDCATNLALDRPYGPTMSWKRKGSPKSGSQDSGSYRILRSSYSLPSDSAVSSQLGRPGVSSLDRLVGSLLRLSPSWERSLLTDRLYFIMKLRSSSLLLGDFCSLDSRDVIPFVTVYATFCYHTFHMSCRSGPERPLLTKVGQRNLFSSWSLIHGICSNSCWNACREAFSE